MIAQYQALLFIKDVAWVVWSNDPNNWTAYQSWLDACQALNRWINEHLILVETE